MAKLGKKQAVFVEEYLIDLNATQAAIRAGYSTKTAKEIGCENLSKPNIASHIDKAIAERSKRTGINQDRIIKELARIALVNPTKVINFDEATVRNGSSDDDTACIASIKVKKIPTEDGYITEREIKFHDKLKALDMLGRHNGMFKDDKISNNIVIINGEDKLED